MPMIIIFHEVHTFTGYGVGDDDTGFVGDGPGHATGVYDTFDIIAIDLEYMPAKTLPFALEILERHDIFGVAVDLYVVTVDDTDEIVQFVFAGKHRSFPDITLVELAVTHHDIDPALRVHIDIRHRVGHASTLAQPAAKWPAGSFYSW